MQRGRKFQGYASGSEYKGLDNYHVEVYLKCVVPLNCAYEEEGEDPGGHHKRLRTTTSRTACRENDC